uniref:Uncharacterized protein n=1 Tax=Mola mola TaxID=94237 RepID=A0A3Q4BBC2_MOLML
MKPVRELTSDMGNKFASSGDFVMAVKFFTDAIKYNPTEYKLFGNRSFCFEKMQEYAKALADAELSLSMCPGWVKGLFRKGRALAGLKVNGLMTSITQLMVCNCVNVRHPQWGR